MSATNGAAVLDRVREALQDARTADRPVPGRRAMARALGVSEYAVRRALDALAADRDDARDEPTPARDEAGAHPEADRDDAGTPTPIPPGDASPGGEPAPEPVDEPDRLVAPAPAPAGRPLDEREPAKTPKPWPLILIGLAAAVAVWGGWVELGHLTGFGLVQPLPGVWDELRINTAIVLPIGIEAYGGYALRTWLSSASLTERTRRFARWSALASLAVGAGAQVASHLMRAGGVTSAPPMVTVLVACVPVAVLGLATGLATLVRRDAARDDAAGGVG